MVNDRLFLGLCLSPSLEFSLKECPPAIFNLYVNHNDSAYLQKVSLSGQTYLGKLIDSPLVFSELEMIKENIYSLLKCLNPDEQWEKNELFLHVLSEKI